MAFSGDILENYCYRDDLVNVARIMFAVAVMLTYPVECFVTREVCVNTTLVCGQSCHIYHCIARYTAFWQAGNVSKATRYEAEVKAKVRLSNICHLLKIYA